MTADRSQEHGEPELLPLLERYDELLQQSPLDSQDTASKGISNHTDALPELAADEFAQLRECVDLLEQLRLQNGGDDQRDGACPDYVGRFEVLRRLGRGGGGTVYLAYDPKLDRHVAVKVPHAHVVADSKLRKRFVREAEAVARLQHPHILEVYEVGNAAAACYIASPYIKGQNLAEWMASNPGPAAPDLVVEWMLQLAGAVGFSHRNHVLHREIKPSNVLLAANAVGNDSNDDKPQLWTVKLADFGLAKRVDNDETLTLTGVTLGTPGYMAPEQVEGEQDEIGWPTDIWSIGVVLYELLYGHAPFAGKSNASTFQRVLSHDPSPPRAVASRAPADLQAICLKCLNKRPQDRYATADELADDLQRFKAGVPTLARPLSTAEAFSRWMRRHPALAFSGGLSIVAACLIAVVTWFAMSRIQLALNDAENLLYTSDMRLAAQAVEGNDVQYAKELLNRHIPKSKNDIDRRSFAWQYLWDQLHQEQASFTMPDDDTPEGASFTSDGKRLLVIAEGKHPRLHVFDASNWHWLETLQTDVPLTRIAFGATGKYLAAFRNDEQVEIRQLDTLKLVSVAEVPNVLACAHFDDQTGELVFATKADDVLYLQQVDLTPSADKPAADTNDGEPTPHQRIRLGKHIDIEDMIAPPGSEWVYTVGFRSLRVWRRHGDRANTDPKPEFDATRIYSIIAVSPDQTQLATSNRHGRIDVWDAHSGEMLYSLEGHPNKVYALQYSADGKRLLSTGKDGTVRTWDLQQQSQLANFKGHSAPVYGACFGPAMERVVSCSRDGTVRIGRFKADAFHVKSFDFCASSSDIQSTGVGFGAYPGHVLMATPSGLQTLGRHAREAAVQVSADGRYMVSIGSPLFESPPGTIPTLLQHFDPDGDGDIDPCAAFDSRMQRLVWQENRKGELQPPRLSRFRTSIAYNRIRVFRFGDTQNVSLHGGQNDSQVKAQLSSLRPLESGVLPHYPNASCPLDVDRDGVLDVVFASTNSNRISWLRLKERLNLPESELQSEPIAELEEPYDILPFALTPGGEDALIVATQPDQALWLIRRRDAGFAPPQRIAAGITGFPIPKQADVDGDGDGDLVCASNDAVIWFENQDGNLDGQAQQIKTLDESWTSTPTANLVVWDLETRQAVYQLRVWDHAVTVAVSPGGRLIAVSNSADKRIQVWHIGQNRCVAQLPPVEARSRPFEMRFSSDAQRLYFTAGDSVFLWDFHQQRYTEFKGHTDGTEFAYLVESRNELITSSADMSLKIWDATTGRCKTTLLGHKKKPHCFCVSPNERILASAGADGEVVLFDLVTNQMLLRLAEWENRAPLAIRFLDAQTLQAVGDTVKRGSSSDRFTTIATWRVSAKD